MPSPTTTPSEISAPAGPHGWRRRLPVGAEVVAGGGVHFRVWAPARRQVEVVGGGRSPMAAALDREPESGYFSGFVAAAGPGATYRFRLDGGEAYPDPASRFQPEGPHGPSQVVDPAAYRWRDGGWRGAVRDGQVIYEMHLGTFSPAGTWAGAMGRLPDLVDLGVTMLELMPVAEFAGRFGWGYDGVDLFAPTRLYGRPDDFRYGGSGSSPPEDRDGGWRLTGQAAVALRPVPREDPGAAAERDTEEKEE